MCTLRAPQLSRAFTGPHARAGAHTPGAHTPARVGTAAALCGLGQPLKGDGAAELQPLPGVDRAHLRALIRRPLNTQAHPVAGVVPASLAVVVVHLVREGHESRVVARQCDARVMRT
eukprot:2960097-Prymnesium_polylepis.2